METLADVRQRIWSRSLNSHPWCAGILTASAESQSGTLSGGQFGLGRSPPSSNGGARRSPQGEWKSPIERKGIRWLNCETDRSSRNESWSYTSGGPEWKGHRSSDKSYPGDNRLMPPESSYRRRRLHLDVGSSHPGAEAGPKGWSVRPLKRYVSWVQNVVRQFGPYPLWAQGI